MTWVLAFALAAACFVMAAFVLKAPRAGWEAIGAALLLGVAGYGLQASPGLPGAPKAAVEKISGDGAAAVAARGALSGKGSAMPGNRWLLTADAFARHGQYADAAGVLQGAIEAEPANAEAWLAMGNALVGHADQTLTPAALFAFQRASAAAPGHPGPPFFLGLALAQSGRLTEARGLWVRLLQDSPPDAPWRADLEQRLGELDRFIARRQAMGQPVQ